jgi:hypothetical protein
MDELKELRLKLHKLQVRAEVLKEKINTGHSGTSDLGEYSENRKETIEVKNKILELVRKTA